MNITITGPRSVGKSTISKIVAEKLGLEYISSDKIGEDAMKHLGGLDKAIKSGKIKGFLKQGGYTLILDVYKSKKDFVFDLSGGSVSSRSVPKASKEVREAANKKSIVIGLLPSEDKKESVQILFEREKERKHFKESDKKELFEKTKDDYGKFPKTFKRFCDFIIYTNKKSPEEIADEITKRLNS